MTPENRNSAIAAALLLAIFGLGAFYLPTIMLAVGDLSPVAAGIVAVLFVAAFFLVFWLRGKSQRRREKELWAHNPHFSYTFILTIAHFPCTDNP